MALRSTVRNALTRSISPTVGPVCLLPVAIESPGSSIQSFDRRFCRRTRVAFAPIQEITVGRDRRVLGPGEAYYFDSRRPHRFRNAGVECDIISACSRPSC